MNGAADKALPTVQVVVPAWNEERYIGACLESLRALEYPTALLEIVVVDNGSTDRTCRVVEEAGLKLLRVHGVNVGAVRNIGASESNSDLIAFIDGDCVAPPDWLSRGLEVLQSHGADAVGGTALLRERPSWVERAWVLDNSPDSSPRPATILQGCAILITREAFDSAGRFDESIAAGEDTLLYEALRKQRHKVIFDPRFSVVHLDYPASLVAAGRRQFWHASDYLRSNKGILNDPTYVLTWVSVVLLAVFAIGVLLAPAQAVTALLVWSALPLLLSLKRLRQANWPRCTVLKLIQIYLVDVSYLLGRSLGLLRSLLRL